MKSEIKELREPVWEMQEWESEQEYIWFGVYYLRNEDKGKTVRDVCYKYCRDNEIWDDVKIEELYKRWLKVCRENSWVARESEWLESNASMVIVNEVSNLTEFKNEGLRIVKKSVNVAKKTLDNVSELMEEYMDKMPVNEDGGKRFYPKDLESIVNSQIKAIKGCDLAMEMSTKMLAIDQAIERLINDEREQEELMRQDIDNDEILDIEFDE